MVEDVEGGEEDVEVDERLAHGDVVGAHQGAPLVQHLLRCARRKVGPAAADRRAQVRLQGPGIGLVGIWDDAHMTSANNSDCWTLSKSRILPQPPSIVVFFLGDPLSQNA